MKQIVLIKKQKYILLLHLTCGGKIKKNIAFKRR